jgi:hypothetical protein
MMEIDKIDELIVDSFIELVDEGFNIEVLYQNGYCTYQIYNPELQYFNVEKGLSIDSYDERFEDDMLNYINSLSKINQHVIFNKDRIMATTGLVEFYFYINQARLEISFNNKPQGYGGLGPKLIMGCRKGLVYHD